MGCDLVIDREAGCLRAFQSTHPVWDATRADEALRAIVNFNPRIPYGMRPGWLTLSMLLLLNFNPRIPYGMRPHAHPQDHPARHFNPRIPYGMRRNRAPILTNKLLFQSTHPVWDATQTLLMTSHFVIFQSTHPVWDATSSSRSITARINFNPRIPYEMRQTSSCRALVTVIFQSTHPVWDATPSRRDAACFSVFQSTHPVWDATYACADWPTQVKISIHASRMGCDFHQFCAEVE